MCQSAIRIILRDIYLSSLFDAVLAACHCYIRIRKRLPLGSEALHSMYDRYKYTVIVPQHCDSVTRYRRSIRPAACKLVISDYASHRVARTLALPYTQSQLITLSPRCRRDSLLSVCSRAPYIVLWGEVAAMLTETPKHDDFHVLYCINKALSIKWPWVDWMAGNFELMMVRNFQLITGTQACVQELIRDTCPREPTLVGNGLPLYDVIIM
ncbi:hypothetical protein CBL_11808 [Carabus blaptoides fortunei]